MYLHIYLRTLTYTKHVPAYTYLHTLTSTKHAPAYIPAHTYIKHTKYKKWCIHLLIFHMSKVIIYTIISFRIASLTQKRLPALISDHTPHTTNSLTNHYPTIPQTLLDLGNQNHLLISCICFMGILCEWNLIR